MAVRIQFRRGTAAEWTSANPTLATGEVGYETDNQQFKIGDGTTDWANLSYAAVSAGYVDNAIANVIDLAPSTLDTLNELAAAIGDDADFINTINTAIGTAESNATSYADSVSATAQSAAQGYADNAIANLVASAPGTLDTLNELAAALGDDANFANTVTASLGTKLAYVVDTEANLTANTSATESGTIYISSDGPGYAKLGDGVNDWANLVFIAENYIIDAVNGHSDETTNVHGIANTLDLVATADLTDLSNTVNAVSTVANTASETANTAASDISAHTSETTNVHGILDTADLVVTADLGNASSTEIGYLVGVTSGVQDQFDSLGNTYATLADPTFTGNVTLPSTTSIGNVTSDELASLDNVSSNVQDQLDAKLETSTAATTYAPLADATLTGTVSLPTTTSIGNVSGTEISYLDNVSSNIQTQLNGKLASAAAATTYAPLANATLTGDVTLPATTDIGTVTGTEISYLANTTSEIQGQIDSKLATTVAANTYAPIDGPTFTTSATLPAATTIGNVSATEISYVEGVTSSIQTQLNAKAPLAGATFTGSVEVPDITVTGNLYVQGSTTTISTSDLKVRDNMLYMNQAGLFDLSNAVGDGTNVVYTTSATHDYAVGDFVTIANTNPSSFDITGEGSEILAVTDNTFTVASTVTDTYVSGGAARGKIHANPDLGWAAGRYAANTYAHAGFFRDATDGVFKVFDGYVPEPDESAFIDTSHNTFALASFAAATVTAANVVATTGITFADNTVQTSAGVPSLTGFTEKTANYTLDTLDHKDNVVEMNNANAITFTIPTDASLDWPVGASMDIIQTNTGQVTVTVADGVTTTLNYTPGNKLRTQWSSCTIMKRAANSWILYGDLTA